MARPPAIVLIGVRRDLRCFLTGGWFTLRHQISAGRTYLSAFAQGLAELGWIDGRNATLDIRWGAGDAERLRSYAAELVAWKPEVLVAVTTPALAGLRAETGTIPIVFNSVTDPVAQGFVASLARSGGNITGLGHWESSASPLWSCLSVSGAAVLRCGGSGRARKR